MTQALEKTEIITIFSKGLVGAIPFIGPLASEIIGATIPNQRLERIELFLKKLESKIDKTEYEKVKVKAKEPESIDLFEDSLIQASRALSEERKEYIASLLKNSLTDEELEHIEYKRLLNILSELNDLEILILKSKEYMYCDDDNKAKEFWKKHGEALKEPIIYDGMTSSEELNKATLFKTHKSHLVNLGLLKAQFKIPNSGEPPEFDKETGMIKASGYYSSDLGSLLLEKIGI